MRYSEEELETIEELLSLASIVWEKYQENMMRDHGVQNVGILSYEYYRVTNQAKELIMNIKDS